MDTKHWQAHAGLGSVTPSHRETPQVVGTNRKRLLLEILDALDELSNQNLVGPDDQPKSSLQKDPEDPSNGDPFHRNGVTMFHSFRKRINDLDRELENLAQAFRTAGILSSSFQLRARLSRVYFLFSENAAELFPQIAREHPPNVSLSTVRTLKGFPEELEHLAEDLGNFIRCLHDYPESKQERLTNSALNFQGDLKYWASCLQDFKGQFRDPAVQRYMHDICEEISNHLHYMTSSMESVVDVVVPAIRAVQQQESTTLVSLSGLATFVSAVTAIQIAFDQNGGPLNNAVNILWFTSLVLSIASAVNSLLILVWTQSTYRSPRNRVPWWISIWIGGTHLVSLILALVAFSLGLVLFTWASGQHLVTCILTTAFTLLNSLGLLAVCVWFAFERFIFIRHGGQQLLADVISDLATHGKEDILLRSLQHLHSYIKTQRTHILQVSLAIVNTSRRVWSALITPRDGDAHINEEGGFPDSNRQSTQPIPVTLPVELSERLGEAEPVPPGESALPDTKAVLLISSKSDVEAAGDMRLPVTQLARGWLPSVSSEHAGMSVTGTREKQQRDVADLFAANTSQITGATYPLDTLKATETLPVHQAMVSQLQFSPDGQWLATGSWDASSILFKVGNMEPFTLHRTLAQPRPVNQVAWAPKGQNLLTNVHGAGSIRIWTEDGVCVKAIERSQSVKCVTWLPYGQALIALEGDFFSLEGSEVTTMDLDGLILTSHPLPSLYLHDVAVSPDKQRMLGVATVIKSPDGLQPHMARKESRIIGTSAPDVLNLLSDDASESWQVYNLAANIIESQVPISHALEIVRISGDGQFALVSCKYGGKNPTQLWRIQNFNSTVQLSLCHTYTLATGVDIAGPSYFGGKHDEFILVLCAGKDGHVSIWDRDNGTLVHNLSQPGGDLTAVAWNSGSEIPMLATGSFNGTITIWTPELPPPSPTPGVLPSGTAFPEDAQAKRGTTER